MDDSPDRGDDPADSDEPGASADGSDGPDGAEGSGPSDDVDPTDEAHTTDGSVSDDGVDNADGSESIAGDGANAADTETAGDDAGDGDADDDAEGGDDDDDAEGGDDDDDAEGGDADDVGAGVREDADGSADADAEKTYLEETDAEIVGDEPDTVDPEIDDIGFEGPESDEEMPLADHIEEMVRRLAIVFGVAGVVTLIAYPASAYLIEFLWQSYIPAPDANRPHIYGPLEYVLAKLKVAGLSGTIVGLPVFVYQTYRFMKPGLYSQERRYYLASVPTSLVLAIVGVVFAHLVILPLTMVYFTSYTADAAVVAFGLQETFNLIVVMMGYMAIVFQIPLFIMLAIMMGLVSRRWMEDKRILFWGAFGGLAFTFVSVDPTGMAPIIIAVTMIVLFEGTLLLLRWTGN